jgi:hypothetical protein
LVAGKGFSRIAALRKNIGRIFHWALDFIPIDYIPIPPRSREGAI